MNPFRFGKPVTGENFCNRTSEIERLSANILSANSIWLYSPRRYGKTSLVKEALIHTGDQVESAFIDLYGITNNDDFCSTFLRGISPLVGKLSGGFEKAMGLLRQVLSSARPQLEIDASGSPILSLAVRAPSKGGGRVIEEILGIPERLAKKQNRRVVIAFDEFQEISRIPGLEQTLRSVLQHQERVSCIFSGSRRTMLFKMFTGVDRPFFNFADHMTLSRIPAPELDTFLTRRFTESGIEPPVKLVRDLIDEAEEHPHFTQYFASHAWDLLVRTRQPAEPLEILWRERVVTGLDTVFRMVFDMLSSGQQRVLRHLASHGSDRLFSEETRVSHGLGSSSSVSAAVKALAGKDVLEKTDAGVYRFVNPAFRLWLRIGLHRM